MDANSEAPRSFPARIAASVIVNQATLRCLVLGIPVTSENIVRLVGDFVDPADPQSDGVVREILLAVEEMTSPLPDFGRGLDS